VKIKCKARKNAATEKFINAAKRSIFRQLNYLIKCVCTQPRADVDPTDEVTVRGKLVERERERERERGRERAIVLWKRRKRRGQKLYVVN
jgi:hypothetical protein